MKVWGFQKGITAKRMQEGFQIRLRSKPPHEVIHRGCTSFPDCPFTVALSLLLSHPQCSALEHIPLTLSLGPQALKPSRHHHFHPPLPSWRRIFIPWRQKATGIRFSLEALESIITLKFNNIHFPNSGCSVAHDASCRRKSPGPGWPALVPFAPFTFSLAL